MRILHVADRLSARGGAYRFMLGVIDGLSGGHAQRLAVGRDEGVEAPCAVFVRPGLDSRTSAEFELDDLAAWASVIHLHNVVNPLLLEWAAARPNALLTVQDHRFFCPGRGKWTRDGRICHSAAGRETCAPCFEDAAYFADVSSLSERRLAAARRLPLTVLSRYMREELVSAGAPAASIHLVPPFVSGLDLEARPSGPPCVLFVGRLAEAKGVLDAVEAWRGSGLPLPLVLAGTGPLRDRLRRETLRSDGPAVEIPGWLDAKSLSGVYARALALLLPSRWQEPFGIAGIEALAFGVPVVAWESGGVSEWHPGPGLVEWGDVAALSRALREWTGRKLNLRPRFERDETLGRLLALYGRLAG